MLETLLQQATRASWSNSDVLPCVLMVTYTAYVVLLESRNEVWPYEYMAFSRRIGELWEPFCKLCFKYPTNNLTLFVPPLFSEARQKLVSEIETYIEALNVNAKQKAELKHYYAKVWSLITSGEIKLELDLHFELDGNRFVIDFKSGFGSNEKGNTSRLLLVGTIYKNLEENYKCVILVRSEEDSNNSYFRVLKRSSIWEAYCGHEAYTKIKEYSGFDIKEWITSNVNWEADLKEDLVKYLKSNNLDQYLKW